MTDTDLAATVATLSVHVQGVAERLRTIEQADRQHGAELAQLRTEQVRLATVVEKIAAASRAAEGPEPKKPAPVDWLTVAAPIQAADMLVGIWQWTDRVWRHHHPDMPPCWPLHARVVEELRSLQVAWETALEMTERAPSMMTSWLTQARVQLRVSIIAELKACRPDQHRDRSTTVRGAFDLGDCPEETLMDVAAWWVEGRGASTPVPGLQAVAP